MKVHPVHPTKTPVAASERGPADGLMAVGLFATHQTARIAGAVLPSAVPSLTSSSPSVQQKEGLEAKKGDSGLSESDGPGWTQQGCPRAPGRMDAACHPRRPITSPAPEGPISKFGACMDHPRHRTDDPLVESDRPGTSPLGSCHWGFKAPGASARPGAGHSGGTAQRVAQRQHSYRTSHPQPSGSRTRRYRAGGWGDKKKPNFDRTSSPARPQRHHVSTDRIVSEH